MKYGFKNPLLYRYRKHHYHRDARTFLDIYSVAWYNNQRHIKALQLIKAPTKENIYVSFK